MRKIFLLCLFMFVNVVYATDVELAWYDGDTTINGPTSCTVGGTFLPPTPPARTGFVFNGWKIKPRTCGIDQLDTSINGSYYGYTRLNGSAGSKESDYGLTVGSGQWATKFSYGAVWGMANCNSTTGTASTLGTPNTSVNGTKCWCQATGFTTSGNSYTSGPSCTTTASSSWVFRYGYDSADSCANNCGYRCANDFMVLKGFRTAASGAAGQ